MKSLNELADDLKDTVSKLMTENNPSLQGNYHRCNNLKITMEPDVEIIPHVIVNMAMSEAMFSLKDLEKLGGSLGPEERYVLRWFGKSMVLENLKSNWAERMREGRKAADAGGDPDAQKKVY